MKFLLALSLTLFSLTAAAWNEVECDGQLVGNKTARVEVEQAFPNGSYFKRAQLIVTEDGAQTVTTFTVTTRSYQGFNRVEYSAPDFRLEVDFWPDQYPRWGMMYRGTFQSSVVGNMGYRYLNCRFPNAF